MIWIGIIWAALIIFGCANDIVRACQNWSRKRRVKQLSLKWQQRMELERIYAMPAYGEREEV